VFLVRSPRMKSTASAETDANKSSGKSRFTCEMFSIVSCFVLPANGAQPVSMTYANTPTLLYQTHHISEILCRLCLTYRVTSQHGDIPDSSWHSYTLCYPHRLYIITFHARRSRGEMYIGHVHLYIGYVHLSFCPSLHSHTTARTRT